ncbi:MAG: hypothetical protein WCT53_01640 [Candidatus Gracilibacteria bacterium]
MELQGEQQEGSVVDIKLAFSDLARLINTFREIMPEGVLDEYSEDPVWDVVEEFKESDPSELIRVPSRNGNRYMTLAHYVSTFFVNSVCRNLAADVKLPVRVTRDEKFVITTPKEREQVTLAIRKVLNLVNDHLDVPVEIDESNGDFIVR